MQVITSRYGLQKVQEAAVGPQGLHKPLFLSSQHGLEVRKDEGVQPEVHLE